MADPRAVAQMAPRLTGSIAIAFVLAFSRWGTVINIGPLYATDILIAVAIVHAISTYSTGPLLVPWWRQKLALPPSVFIAFLTYVALRFVTSFGTGPTLDWVRDAVPYLYGFLAIMSATTYARADEERKARTFRLFISALAVHQIWVLLWVFTPLRDTLLYLPGLSSSIFQIRPDIDCALSSVFVGLCLRSALRGQHLARSSLGLVAGTASVLGLYTRAGLISLVVIMAVAVLLEFTKRRDDRRMHTKLLVLVVVSSAAFAAILPATPPGQRAIATIFPNSASTAQQLSAQGTQQARQLVWSGVIGWTDSDPLRATIGTGFGTDFLAESGTLNYLEGTEYTGVRSPHNYFVGSFARLGYVGDALLVLSLLYALSLVWRRRRQIIDDSIATFATFVVVAILPVASLGVVMEAPFGAVPFFWALGILYQLRLGWPNGEERGNALNDRRCPQSPRILQNDATSVRD